MKMHTSSCTYKSYALLRAANANEFVAGYVGRSPGE
jgi:hypothetical protein